MKLWFEGWNVNARDAHRRSGGRAGPPRIGNRIALRVMTGGERVARKI
jgi:hypothetical protein